MYPFDELRPAYDRFWSRVSAGAPWLPPSLDWDRDLHESWVEPDLAIAQTCGWPLVTELADRVRVVGAFEPLVSGAVGHCYRSVLVGREQCAIAELMGAHAAVNSPSSLSGWVSLVAAVHGPGGAWTGTVTWTGAHRRNVVEVAEGRADVASIDAVTWAFISRFSPELTAGLVEIGSGPLVPSLPLITAASTTDEQLAALRGAITAALRDSQTVSVARELCIGGFVPLDLDDYLPLLSLGGSRMRWR